MNSEIYGLVLVGGQSQRMGRDKALLSYDGEQTQLERTAALLKQVCSQVFISQREAQAFPTPEGTQAIYDSMDSIKGPLCGILSAMRAHPEAHWLVLACDLPFLQVATLKKLISAFSQAGPQLTAYRSTHDGLPEPLCALYPAGSDTGLLALSQELGKCCPRKLLIVQEAALVEQDDPRSLDNINTAEEYETHVSLVLLRVLAISFLVETMTAITSQIPMLRMFGSDFGEDGFAYTQMILWTMGTLIVAKIFMGILLLVYSDKLADRIVGENNETLEAHPQLGYILTHVGIILIGISSLLYSLPRFATTAIQWFQSHAQLPENMASQQNGAMAQATLLFVLSLFLLLRGKTLTRWLIRLSK